MNHGLDSRLHGEVRPHGRDPPPVGPVGRVSTVRRFRRLAGRVIRRLATRTPETPGISVAHEVDREADSWFWNHYEWAAQQVIEFMGAAGLGLDGRDVADVGCGDGITDLGLVSHASPRRLVGFDVNPVDIRHLLNRAKANLDIESLPENLEFTPCEPDHLPAEDASFDVVVTWSAFEHIADPVSVLGEVRRVLKPDGTLFLQLFPFYHSQHGSHLEEWYPEGFIQYKKSPAEIRSEVLSRSANPGWAEYMLNEFEHLNKVTLDELGHALRRSGFVVTRLHLVHHTINVPWEARDVDLSLLANAGVMLLAVKDA